MKINRKYKLKKKSLLVVATIAVLSSASLWIFPMIKHSSQGKYVAEITIVVGEIDQEKKNLLQVIDSKIEENQNTVSANEALQNLKVKTIEKWTQIKGEIQGLENHDLDGLHMIQEEISNYQNHPEVLKAELIEELCIDKRIDCLLNYTTLNPLKTGYDVLDVKVEQLLSEITNTTMTTYEKVKAIYDYIIYSMRYQQADTNFFLVNQLETEYGIDRNDAREIALAMHALQNKYGSCDHYSALFMVLTRRLGLESYTINARNWSGLRHTTVNIKINHEFYDFDPQGDANSRRGGGIKYYYFGKNDQQASKLYQYSNRENDIARFKNFKSKKQSLEALEDSNV